MKLLEHDSDLKQGSGVSAPPPTGGGESGVQPQGSVDVYGPGLLPQHAQLVAGSVISPAVARQRGYRSVTRKAELNQLGFKVNQRNVPALLVPIHGVGGGIVNYQLRPDHPRIGTNGKPLKYETVAGSRMTLDVPPGVRSRLSDPSVPLIITEGARKADAAVSVGLCCIDLLGVWNWRGSNELGGKVALADWESIALNGRRVLLCFDSDVMEKPAVHAALARLKPFLESRRANVEVIYLPDAESGEKVGLDDYLAQGHSAHDLLALAEKGLRPLPTCADDSEPLPYTEEAGGLAWRKEGRDGHELVPLTNFTARIKASVVEDDGGEEPKRALELAATVKGRTSTVTVLASEFSGMNWVLQALGPEAVVHAGMAKKDHTRAAIQLLSGDVPERRVYAHTGWREIEGEWAYLHAGGALGSDGEREGVAVRLDGTLRLYELPPPPSGPELIHAVQASLALLDLSQDVVTFPLLASTCRAVIGPVDFSVFLVGPSGAFKSELASLAQRHFGAEMDRLRLPAAWESTDNALEGLAFRAKDALLTVDDFAPTGTPADVDRLHKKADRVLRGQGNHSGRQRMRPDTTLREPRPPRGLILATGEDLPRGHSLRARLCVLEVEPGSIAPGRLAEEQQRASRGLFAMAMSAFICWLAGRYADVRRGLRDEIDALREEASGSGAHRRTPEIVANLMLGLRYLLAFASEVGAISEAEAERLRARGWEAFGQVAAAQVSQQLASEPTQRFFDLLGAALVSGQAHVASVSGMEPKDSATLGWRRQMVGKEPECRPQGRRVGWTDGNSLYLDPVAAYQVAQAVGRDIGEGVPISLASLRKRLYERGLLASRDEKRQTYTVRRCIEGGGRREVLHLSARGRLILTSGGISPDHLTSEEDALSEDSEA